MNLINKINFDKDVWGAPDGVSALVVSILAREQSSLVYVARDDARMNAMGNLLSGLLPDFSFLEFPAWDCLPFDRLSPQGSIVGKRIETLARLTADLKPESCDTKGALLLTTVNSFLQRVPEKSYFSNSSFILDRGKIAQGSRVGPSALSSYLNANAYLRTDTVRETGEYAIRGGIFDIFPPGQNDPVRLDFFGDEVDTIRRFDPVSQRTIGQCGRVILRPVSELSLNATTISRFRTRYLSIFGAQASRDSLYESVSAGQTHVGIEHWSPLFHEQMSTLYDYCKDWHFILDHEADAAINARYLQIKDFYNARVENIEDDVATSHRPLAETALYLSSDESENFLKSENVTRLFSFSSPNGEFDAGGRIPPKLITSNKNNIITLLLSVVKNEQKATRRPVVVACSSIGVEKRLQELVELERGFQSIERINTLQEVRLGGFYVVQWPLASGFETDHIIVFSETDVFGQRSARPNSRRSKGSDFLREASVLQVGDLVVHAEHGIGRYEGLVTINSVGDNHDCLHLIYAGGDKLYLPVENIELLSRYGGSGAQSNVVQLDRLGGSAWQARIARVKGRIKVMAEQLIEVAARRYNAKAESLVPEEVSFREFCGRFAYNETEDQMNAINDVLIDLASGRVSDRLICGDVGFGKTEVALRATFVVAMAGYQVALVTPTTLLARQHGKVFIERFRGLPVKVRVLSRMTSYASAKNIRTEIESGELQVAIGTHALLAKTINFNNLGLLIIDEEQHFGVGQKERLKEIRSDVHVLTLSATPIPRTLQMALSGVREMSLISTPPIDRLVVRTFVGPWDGVVIREAIQREIFRGGQIFIVCPRIDHMQKLYERVSNLVPKARVLSAHGRLPAAELDTVMDKFSSGEADILISTNIIESGIDIPSANTLIIHRSDMFGLSQLYQLRGRVGRGRQRAYAYLTTDPQRLLSPEARRRLEVMQTLDTLGAGFTLASHDMDIRGAGNLLGDEQSGNVREVGVELYQEMLQTAVDAAKLGKNEKIEVWTPQINLGVEVRLPDDYVPDLSVRLSLYRRIAELSDSQSTNALIAELIDRFGDLPGSVKNLFAIIELKQLCRNANVERIDAGPKGVSLSFRKNSFKSPENLIGWIDKNKSFVQLHPDHRLVYTKPMPEPAMRIFACQSILNELVSLV